MITALHDGTGEFIWVGLVALSLLAADRFSHSMSFRSGGLLTVLLVSTIYCCWYYGASVLLVVCLPGFSGGEILVEADTNRSLCLALLVLDSLFLILRL